MTTGESFCCLIVAVHHSTPGSTDFNFFDGLTPLGTDRLAWMNTLKQPTSCYPLNTQILSNAHFNPLAVLMSNNCSGEKQFKPFY